MSPKELLRRAGLIVFASATLLMTANCAHMPQNMSGHSVDDALDDDPLEPFNRVMFGFNRVVDAAVLKPITTVYRAVVPEKGRELVSNFVENLYTPVSAGNSLLQGDIPNTFANFWTFTLNTTMGMGGLFDVAAETSLNARKTDFGQTLAVYGGKPSAYLVLPIIGPSNLRDGVGRVADAFMNPFNYLDDGYGLSMAMWGVTAVDQRSINTKLIDGIYESSLDPYATFRSGFTQKRAADVRRAIELRAKSIEDSMRCDH